MEEEVTTITNSRDMGWLVLVQLLVDGEPHRRKLLVVILAILLVQTTSPVATAPSLVQLLLQQPTH